MRKYVLIVCIVLFAGVLRFWNITQVPPSLNSDEVAIGYNAYSVLQTGKDEYGIRFPLTFRSFDDYKMPLYVYMVSASMKVFGFGDFAVRFPSALFGSLTVLVTYLLVRELFHKERIALLAAFLFAVSPWSVHFSRSGYEANVAVFFIVSGVFMFLRRSYIASAVLLSLSVWTYLTPRIFVPLLMVGLAVIYWRELLKHKIKIVIGGILALVLLFPIIRMSVSSEGQMRAMGVSAFTNPDDLRRSALRLEMDKSIFRLFDNRRITYAITFLRGYFAHFDPNFLFLDKSIEKYRAPDMGLLYLFELPLFLSGAYMLIRKWTKGSALVFWWIAAAPVAAAFTLQLPHPVRTLVFLPSFQIVSAVGLDALWRYWRVAVVVLVISVSYYLHHYFSFLPIEDAQYWYVGRREMTNKIAALEHEYDKIIVSNALDFPYIFYLYYRPVKPSVYLASGGTVSGGFTEQENKFGNVEFRSLSESQRDPVKNILFIGLPGEVFKKSLIVDTIYYPDKTPAIVFFK